MSKLSQFGNTNIALLVLLLSLSKAHGEEAYKIETELYSRIDINAQLSDEGGDKFTEVKSNNSWIGLTGGTQLTDDLSVIYKLEWKVDITGESGSENLTARPQYLGLQSKRFGAITVGRQFTSVWRPGRALDLYNHYEGDIKTLWQGENRLTDVIKYSTPTFNNFRIETMYQADKSEDGDSSVSSGIFYGDRKLNKTQFYGGIAHDFGVENYDITRVFARYRVGSAMFGALYHQEQPEDQGESRDGVLLNVNYKVNNIQYKVQYQTLEDDSNINVGADYLLSNKLKLYVWFSAIEKENTEDRSYLALGIQYNWSHKF